MGTLQNFSTRHPVWAFVVLVLVVALAVLPAALLLWKASSRLRATWS